MGQPERIKRGKRRTAGAVHLGNDAPPAPRACDCANNEPRSTARDALAVDRTSFSSPCLHAWQSGNLATRLGLKRDTVLCSSNTLTHMISTFYKEQQKMMTRGCCTGHTRGCTRPCSLLPRPRKTAAVA